MSQIATKIGNIFQYFINDTTCKFSFSSIRVSKFVTKKNSREFKTFLLTFLLFLFIIFTTSSTHGVIFDCYIENIPWIQIGQHYACTPQISSSSTGSVLSKVKASHEFGKTNKDVKILSVSGQTAVDRIPSGINEFFPQIIGFQWLGGSLKTVSRQDFDQFPNLLAVNIQRNKLVIIDGDLFLNTPRLKFIGFSENLIKNVGHDLLADLDDLTGVHFQSNPCINRQAANSKQIRELVRLLPISCPPYSAEHYELKKKIADQGKKIISLTNETKELRKIITAYEERFLEIEEKLTEINETLSSPTTPETTVETTTIETESATV